MPARAARIHYFPIALPILGLLFLVLAMVAVLIETGTIEYAYHRIGIQPRYIVGLLFLSLLVSRVNIPVGELAGERIVSGRVVTVFGMRYVVPVVDEQPRTIIAVNLGGAVIPALVSLYLLRHRPVAKAVVGTAIVAVLVHRVARPIPGVGIATPLFVPPLVAAVIAEVLSPEAAAPLAYCVGTLGTLIGADLLNLGKLRGLGAPVASIGGAGTFDAIFLTGVLAVLLA
jgi:uncharacterized membrane protein